ncbi:MAG: hypothetical protein QG670_1639 [Thermoproteota archaeon]|nr:hypothetical protein [Thermoproteota archaeon]
MSSRRLALIGSTFRGAVTFEDDFLRNHSACWSPWDLRIRDEMKPILYQQLNDGNRILLYLFLSKKMGGSGTVEYVEHIDNFVSSPDPIPQPPEPLLTPPKPWPWEHPDSTRPPKTWFRVVKPIQALSQRRRINEFSLYADPRMSATPSHTRRSFAYIIEVNYR